MGCHRQARKLITVDTSESGPLAPELAKRAREQGFGACWCLPLPILDPSAYPRFTPSPGQHPEFRESGDESGEGTQLGCVVVWSRGLAVPSGAYLSTMERVGLFCEIALRRRRDQERIRRLVLHDHLTGALSREGMRTALTETPEGCAQILLDIDDFKSINDRYGHAARLATSRIAASVRDQDPIIRLGGDEFLVLLPGQDLACATVVVRRLLAAFADPFHLRQSARVMIGVSIGLAAGGDTTPAEVITERADQAMYAAKQAGKNRWALWQPAAERPDGGVAVLGS